jgi:anti-sigma-K factor RskA
MREPDDRQDEADLAELRDLMAHARPQDVEWEAPPPGLWERIESAIEEPETSTDEKPKVVPLRRRRPRFLLGVLGAAAVVIIVLAIAAVVTRDDSDGTELVSAVQLDRLGPTGNGRAELVDRKGVLQLHVQTSGLDPGRGFLEVWLIDPTVTKLVSLGPLRPDGVYDIPRGVDPTQFPIVDVSVEPVDGNPAHSGDSVLRGELQL